MSDLITASGRITGTRITVFDVLDYGQAGHHAAFIATTLGLSSDQVTAALNYIAQHRDTVLPAYQKMRERDAQGNSPEVLAKIPASQAKLEALLNGRPRPSGEAESARHPGRQ